MGVKDDSSTNQGNKQKKEKASGTKGIKKNK